MKIRLARKIAHTPIDRLNPYWLDAAVFRGAEITELTWQSKRTESMSEGAITDTWHAVDLRKVYAYSAYLQGARKAMEVMARHFPQIFKGKDAVYNKAEFQLAISSLRNTALYISDEYEIRFRRHEADKKGKCVKCEAYFSDKVVIGKEVK